MAPFTSRIATIQFYNYNMLHKIINQHVSQQHIDILHDQIKFFIQLPVTPGVTAENFYTCYQGLIPSNIHFSAAI